MKGYEINYKSNGANDNKSITVTAEQLIPAITCLQRIKTQSWEVVSVELKTDCNDNQFLPTDSFGMVLNCYLDEHRINRVFVPDGHLEAVAKSLVKKGYHVSWDRWTNRIIEELDMPVMEG